MKWSIALILCTVYWTGCVPGDELPLESDLAVMKAALQSPTSTLQMVWNDEFNGNVLDDSKWSPAPGWFRQGGSYWSNNNYELTGTGQLKLRVTEENGVVYAGAIRTHRKFDKKYGYFETRCKVPQIQGGWAAFWMMPYGNRPGSAGNDGTEIDIFESINGWQGKIQHALHWDGYGAQHRYTSHKMDRPDLYDGGYHKFGLMWTPEEYIFYIDDVETWRTSAGGVADVNQYLKLTMEVSGSTWAGNWNNQNPKTIEWLVDYVRVYDYQPVEEPAEPEEPLSVAFETLRSGTSFQAGDAVAMDVLLAGALSDADELQFLVRKDDGAFEAVTTLPVGAGPIYSHDWTSNESGDYALRVTATKNSSYVTHVVANITVEATSEPFDISYATLTWGMEFNIGDPVRMDVLMTGDLSEIDALQFMTMKQGQTSWTQHDLISVNNVASYSYAWTPTEAGVYKVRVTGRKNNNYVQHVVVSNVTIQEPFDIHFANLSSGEKIQMSDGVVMDVTMTGDLSEVDELRYKVRQDGGNWNNVEIASVTNLSSHSYTWSPSAPGFYSFKVVAKKSGNYVTHAVVNSVQALEPIHIEYRALQNNSTFAVGSEVKMHANVTGDIFLADKIKFVVQKSGGNDTVIREVNYVAGKTAYYKKWIPSEPGNYKLKAQAFKNYQFVTHQTANVTIQ